MWQEPCWFHGNSKVHHHHWSIISSISSSILTWDLLFTRKSLFAKSQTWTIIDREVISSVWSPKTWLERARFVLFFLEESGRSLCFRKNPFCDTQGKTKDLFAVVSKKKLQSNYPLWNPVPKSSTKSVERSFSNFEKRKIDTNLLLAKSLFSFQQKEEDYTKFRPSCRPFKLEGISWR